MTSLYSGRPCWWCGHPIDKRHHAETTDHDGNKVIVHEQCLKGVNRFSRPVTAAPREERVKRYE